MWLLTEFLGSSLYRSRASLISHDLSVGDFTWKVRVSEKAEAAMPKV